jgi:hypothetical protein
MQRLQTANCQVMMNEIYLFIIAFLSVCVTLLYIFSKILSGPCFTNFYRVCISCTDISVHLPLYLLQYVVFLMYFHCQFIVYIASVGI